jgi:DNA-binding NarL/FixJ family response regulator
VKESASSTQTIVSRLVNRPREHGPLDELTEREREVLGLMAEGAHERGH